MQGPENRIGGVKVSLLQRVLGWLMGCGRLQEYSLAVRLGLETGEAEEEPSS